MINDIGAASSGKPLPGHEQLFSQISKISREHLAAILRNCISSADAFLYAICQQDQSTFGSPNIENLKMLRFATPAMELQYAKAAEARFELFLKLLKPEVRQDLDLSLVDIDDTDDVVSVELVSEVLAKNFSEAVSITGRRLCALFGFEATELSKSPLTEKHLAELLRPALHGTDLSPKVRAIVFRNYEEALLANLPALFAAVNKPLVEASVLPQLNPLRNPQNDQIPFSPAGSRPAPESQAAPSPRQPVQRPAGAHGFPEIQLGAAENALFEEICNYLHSLRPQAEAAYRQDGQPQKPVQQPAAAAQHMLTTHEMISVLSELQSSLPESIVNAMKGSDASASIATMLKSEMLEKKHDIGVPYDSLAINREDEDAVDLVGMLFDVLMTERDFREEARTLISRLVVPYAKAAVLDRRLFLTKAHPARKLLNALTEAVEGNHGDGPQERELLNKAESTVDQLVAGFNEDIAIFELLEQELRAFLDQHRRRIDLAEKRAKEAQRGQERLENARMLAARELENRINHAELPAIIQDFFSRYWTHHLSMVALREGEESHSWSAAIKVADDTINVLNTEPPEARFDLLMQMRPSIESVLSSSGVLADSSMALVQRLAESTKHYVAQKSAPAKASARDGVLSESSMHLAFNKSALDYNENDAEFFKNLAIGTWLQFEAGNGGYSPIKLAWVSPISSRLMFVNRRGVRVLVVSVEELAQMKKQGKLIVHAQDNVFEQTMDRVLDRLRTDFG